MLSLRSYGFHSILDDVVFYNLVWSWITHKKLVALIRTWKSFGMQVGTSMNSIPSFHCLYDYFKMVERSTWLVVSSLRSLLFGTPVIAPTLSIISINSMHTCHCLYGWHTLKCQETKLINSLQFKVPPFVGFTATKHSYFT